MKTKQPSHKKDNHDCYSLWDADHAVKLSRTDIRLYLILMIVWLLLALAYLWKTGYRYQHDFGGHVEYTQIISREGRLPDSYRGWQTYQVPLYYIINQLACPTCDHHILFVRCLSVLYGGGFWLVCFTAARWSGARRTTILLTTLYFMTTPVMIQIFTSYNTDSLVILLAGLVLISLWHYAQTAAVTSLSIAIAAAVLAMYTIFSTIYLLLALGIVATAAWSIRKLSTGQFLKFAIILSAPVILLAPWLYFHNYRPTGKLFPLKARSGPIMTLARLDNNGGAIRFLFAPPGISWSRWNTPYATGPGEDDKIWNWTKKDLISSTIVTSVLDEWNYAPKRGDSSKIRTLVAWVMLGFQVLLAGFVLRCWTSKMLLPFSVAFSSWASHGLLLPIVQPFVSFANYRYYAWVVIPLIVLVHHSLTGKRKIIIGQGLLFLGVIAHFTFLVVLD